MFKFILFSQLLIYSLFIRRDILINKHKKFHSGLPKKIIIYIFIVLLIVSANYSINYNYKTVTNNFYDRFNQCDFSSAKQILSSNKLISTVKKNKLHNDLNSYFTSIIAELCAGITSGSIDSSKALIVLKEINTYGVLNSSIDKLIISLDDNYAPLNSSTYNYFLELGIDNYNNKNYAEAVSNLKKIPNSETEESNIANDYINRCMSDYKSDLFKSADELVANKYFTKAIELLNAADNSILSSKDIDILNKINFISAAREEYLVSIDNEEEVYTSTAILETITIDNINTLNIESKTPYILYVNLNEQKTYVYEGSLNNWNLLKVMDCSTGVEGEETPKGIFSVSSRGDWFFSEEYQQGGKYWIQFMGDYLFHSLPFDETQNNIVDYTLGEPASHGCVRLKVEDAKWLYDNVSDTTKVIIN